MTTLYTIGHGTRPASELVECLVDAGVETLVDVRRFPSSRRNPQFNQVALVETLAAPAIRYLHAVELGGRRTGEPGADRFRCIATAGCTSVASWWPSDGHTLGTLPVSPDPFHWSASRTGATRRKFWAVRFVY